MQSFVILYRSFWVYKAGADAETGTWNRALAVQGVGVVSTVLFWAGSI